MNESTSQDAREPARLSGRLHELAGLRQEAGELVAELEAAIAAPGRLQATVVDAFGQRLAAIRAGLDAIEATS